MSVMIGITRFFERPYQWAVVYSICLTLFFAYILLDVFVIPRRVAIVEQKPAETASQPEMRKPEKANPEKAESETPEPERSSSEAPVVATKATVTPAEPVITDKSYLDDNISIKIETRRVHDTDIYIAEIELSEATLLKTAFAEDAYGRNIKDTTSTTAQRHSALLAINGDNYGSRENGFVLRGGVLYRDTPRTPADDDALLIDNAGNFHIIQENESTNAIFENAWQVFTFGPALIENGALAVDGASEVIYSPHSRTANPRTAIGQIEDLRYLVIVADGRTQNSKGLTLLELGELFMEYGCETAYNLDGGGSSTMVFMGETVNRPTTNGRRERERSVNDIVYIGYE